MDQIIPVGTRFLGNNGAVYQVTHYSNTGIRAYCEQVGAVRLVAPPHSTEQRRVIGVTGGRDTWRGDGTRTPTYFEPREHHRNSAIEFDRGELVTDLEQRLMDANEAAQPLLDEARRLRDRADEIEAKARDATALLLGLEKLGMV
jgi:hypothetical protein